MKMVTLNCCILFFLIVGITAKPSNSIVEQCKAKDAHTNECIKKFSQMMFIKSQHGFKEWGIPPMDPLFVPRMSLHNGDGPISLNLDLINITQRGFSKSHIVSVHADPEHYKYELNMTISDYNIKGMYSVSGKILMLPIVGSGPSDITFTGIKTNWKVSGEPVVKNNKKYMNITEFHFSLEPKRMHVKLDNLFNGNKQLGDTMNKFLNDSWEEVFKVLKSGIEETFSMLLTNFGNRAFSKVEYKNIFHDLE